MRGFLLVFAVLLGLSLWGERLVMLFDPAFVPPDDAVHRLAQAALGAVQPASFREDREYCAYLVQLPDGTLATTPMRAGDRDACEIAPLPDEAAGVVVLASLHTHGAYDPDVPAEFPTLLDMDSDRAEGIDGFISTPGGRLWYIDSRARIAVQLCGIACMPQDPRFVPGDDGPIAQRYHRSTLARLDSGH